MGFSVGIWEVGKEYQLLEETPELMPQTTLYTTDSLRWELIRCNYNVA